MTCREHGPTVAVTWTSGGPDACPLCSASRLAYEARVEAGETLLALESAEHRLGLVRAALEAHPDSDLVGLAAATLRAAAAADDEHAENLRLRAAREALILCRRAVAAAPVSECDETCPPDCHAALMREAVTALASLKALEEMGDYAPAGLDVHPSPTPAQREAADPEAATGGAGPWEER